MQIIAQHLTMSLREQEIGPYKMGWKRRRHTWANEANLLFIDSPVGTGWSYVDKHGGFGTRTKRLPLNVEILLSCWCTKTYSLHATNLQHNLYMNRHQTCLHR